MRSLLLRLILKRSLTIFLLSLPFWSVAQILDDSTKLVYGTSTVEVFYEGDIVNETDTTYSIDTLLTGFEYVSIVEKTRNLYQNLGNLGTAAAPIFTPAPDIIGRTSGFHSFDYLMLTPEKNKIYNTKSPFIDLFAQIGGQTRNVVYFEFTQNINPNWNFGFNLNRITADKQLGARLNEGDRNVISTGIDFHMHYDHPEIPYKVFGHFAYLNHNVREVGGVFFPDSVEERSERFQYRDAVIRLQDPELIEKRLNLHLYQEYGLLEQFKLYHILERSNQNYLYTDYAEGNAVSGYNPYTDFYPNFFLDTDSTYEQSIFTSLTNEAGLKGKVGNVFYRFYLKNRIVDHEYLYMEPFDRVIENYLGGESYFDWKDKFKVSVFGEFLQSGEFKLGGSLTSDFLEVDYKTIRYNPSNMSQRIFNNHYFWENEFTAGLANELSGRLKFNYKMFEVSPFANFTTHTNFVYFDADRSPVQTNSSAVITRIGGDLNYTLYTNRKKQEGMHFDNQIHVSSVDGGAADAIRVPTLLYNGRVYWKGNWFEDAIPVELGFNIHAKSSYFTDAYSPLLQQFYIQNQLQERSYMTIDLFLNMQIDKLYVFTKFIYANMPGDDGYFITYLYPGQERIFDLGVRWLFFD